ncbi:Transposon Tf2-9 polyprotein [Labeo rohita]|uniref:Gypsy retrotransposon integrase-like protein 1 n=1 Tax=Labeo rohita TaxID=84645 RepID=A0ABQ8LAU0_LABRO|nr:Transposon Tf2-9 polyprotein [Labeo rohita]
MDPTSPPPSVTALQKTSPPSDPAIVNPISSDTASQASPPSVLQIASELSAQASTLAVHGQQLDRLTDLTGQLVRALQGLQLTPPPAAPPATPPPLAIQPATASPRLAFPEKFDGTAAKCLTDLGIVLSISSWELLPRRAESEAMQKYIQEELAKGFITPSTPPASAGFFFVKKKDGGLRPCIDYRGLNGNHQIPLSTSPRPINSRTTDLRGDEWKTAFSTTSGHYEYRVMPFGLANSPSCFQAFINEVFRDMLNRWVIVYIDDILIYSNSYSEHVQHVRAVLRRLIAHQFYAKEEKCAFHQDKISFLGYIISSERVAMDEEKVEAVLNWPRPSTLRELQRFLGFANFYHHFIRNFSTVAAPLTAMVKRGTSHLTWSQAALQAFDDLRQRFSSAPILHHPDPEKPFVVEVDASSTGIGAVLSQRQGEPPKLFPCAYFSHKLTPAECNYDVGNRELLAIKLALEEWRHWLEGAKNPFTVLTDHRNLEYLRSTKTLNHRQARWALFFTRFNFQVTYRPGSQNTKADALSRIHEPGQPAKTPEPVLPTSIIAAPVAWNIMTEIAEAQTQDPPPEECPVNLTYVPLNLRLRVLSEVHSVPSSGHPGIEATLHLLNNRFWWPTTRLDTINFIRTCAACNTAKVPRRLPAGLLQPLPVPQRPWSHVAVDFVTDLPPSNGHTTILSVVDRFSKACRFIPLPKLPSALETAEVLCNWDFRLYPAGGYCFGPGTAVHFTPLGLLLSPIRSQREPHNHQEDWSRYLFWAEYAQNSLRRPSTNLTPFQCVLGFQPPMFPWSGEPSELLAINSWLQNREETWNQAHVHLQGAVRRAQAQANRRRRPNPPYEPGQWVWLSTRDLCLHLPCRKLNPRYVGPFKIIKQITPVSFRLDLPAEYRISPTFHVSLFKPAGDPEGVEMARRSTGLIPSWTPVAGEVSCSTWSTGRALAQRKDHGSLPEISWTPLSSQNSTRITQIDQHPKEGVDPGDGHLLAPGVARGGGSVTTAVSVALSNHRQREPSPDF